MTQKLHNASGNVFHFLNKYRSISLVQLCELSDRRVSLELIK